MELVYDSTIQDRENYKILRDIQSAGRGRYTFVLEPNRLSGNFRKTEISILADSYGTACEFRHAYTTTYAGKAKSCDKYRNATVNVISFESVDADVPVTTSLDYHAVKIRRHEPIGVTINGVVTLKRMAAFLALDETDGRMADDMVDTQIKTESVKAVFSDAKSAVDQPLVINKRPGYFDWSRFHQRMPMFYFG